MIFIYFIKDLKHTNITKKILNDLKYIIKVNILLKSVKGRSLIPDLVIFYSKDA